MLYTMRVKHMTKWDIAKESVAMGRQTPRGSTNGGGRKKKHTHAQTSIDVKSVYDT
jgi:hypothetical protein